MHDGTFTGGTRTSDGAMPIRSLEVHAPRPAPPPAASADEAALGVIEMALVFGKTGALVEVLETYGLNVALQFTIDGEGRAAVNPDVVKVYGADELRAWMVARESESSGFYGRPESGPCPWGFGAAPRAAELARILLALVEG